MHSAAAPLLVAPWQPGPPTWPGCHASLSLEKVPLAIRRYCTQQGQTTTCCGSAGHAPTVGSTQPSVLLPGAARPHACCATGAVHHQPSTHGGEQAGAGIHAGHNQLVAED